MPSTHTHVAGTACRTGHLCELLGAHLQYLLSDALLQDKALQS